MKALSGRESRPAWSVVVGTFVVLFLVFGSVYSFGTFFAPLQIEFGASRGAVSLAFSVSLVVLFAVGAGAGALADRIGPRRLVIAGMTLVGFGLIAASRAETIWQVQLAFAVGIGVGIGFAYVPSVGTVQKWFDLRRGLASGFAISGIGAGTLAIPPIAAFMITEMGWRPAFLAIGIAVIALGGGAGLVITDPPREAPARETGRDDGSGITLGRAIRSRPFILVLLGFLCASFAQYIPMVHLIPYAEDHGISPAKAAILLSLLGFGSMIGRFAIAGFADRIGRWRTLACTFAGLSLSCLWWLLAVDFIALGGFAFLVGACYGGGVALAPSVMADYFGTRAVSGIIGVLYSGVGLGALAGPALGGVAFDLWHSYTIAIVFCSVVAGIGAILVFSAEDPERWRQRQRSENGNGHDRLS